MTLVNKKKKNEDILKQKEEVGNSLHYIDFHQVRCITCDIILLCPR